MTATVIRFDTRQEIRNDDDLRDYLKTLYGNISWFVNRLPDLPPIEVAKKTRGRPRKTV